MIDNTVYLKRYCNKCGTELEKLNGTDYCNKCKRYVPFYVEVPIINCDKRMWSEKELKELIKETVKEIEETEE